MIIFQDQMTSFHFDNDYILTPNDIAFDVGNDHILRPNDKFLLSAMIIFHQMT